jgi:hypothetical protein
MVFSKKTLTKLRDFRMSDTLTCLSQESQPLAISNVLTLPLLQRTQTDIHPPNDGLQIDHGWLTTSECYYHLAKDAESGMLGAMTA